LRNRYGGTNKEYFTEYDKKLYQIQRTNPVFNIRGGDYACKLDRIYIIASAFQLYCQQYHRVVFRRFIRIFRKQDIRFQEYRYFIKEDDKRNIFVFWRKDIFRNI